MVKLDKGWTSGGQLFLENGYYWGINRKGVTSIVCKEKELEDLLENGSDNPTIQNILTIERNLS